MKHISRKLAYFSLSFLFIFSSIISVKAQENEDVYYEIVDVEIHDEDSGGIMPFTWSDTYWHNTVKTKRVYLGTVTKSTSWSFMPEIKIKGITISLGGVEHKTSGVYRKYRQYVDVTVKYHIRRKVDNKIIDTKTVSGEQSYIDYVPM